MMIMMGISVELRCVGGSVELIYKQCERRSARLDILLGVLLYSWWEYFMKEC